MNFLYFSQLWPRSAFSAAHERTFGIIDRLILNNGHISFVTPQDLKKAEQIKEYIDIKAFQADPSNTHRMNLVLQKVPQPTAAFFDTYVSEAFYSHYVHQLFPNCIKVLDLQDLHCLRIKRAETMLDEQLQSEDVLRAKPILGEDLTDKEITSIIRSDMILSCSDYETLLLNELNVTHKHIYPITFFYPTNKVRDTEEEIKLEMQKQWSRRKNFVFLGNMAHKPNNDSVKYMLKYIWPGIHEALPHAQLHIYGANFPGDIQSDLSKNVHCRGVMKDIEILGKYRVMLAPIRFGAGVKGKITDAWREYLPVVTTPMGAEGLFYQSTQQLRYAAINELNSEYYSELEPDRLSKVQYDENRGVQEQMKEYYKYEDPSLGDSLTFGGSFNNWTSKQFIESSVQLYSEEQMWNQAIMKGEKILKYRMDAKVNEKILMKAISETQANLGQMRKNDVLWRLTWSETLRSNYHFAKYLNEKRKNQELMGRLK